MKKLFLLFPAFILSFFAGYSQNILFNYTNSFYVDAGAIVFVDGGIVNDATGHIKNKGDIYLTKDWTNDEAAGALDPTTGKVILKGNAQTIKGLSTTTFNNLDCQNTVTKTLNINTIVGGNVGVLSLNNAPFNLNSKTLIVTNPLPAAITRNSGYILSETDPTAGYGIVEWRMGNSAVGNNFTYPFGTIAGTYIPFLYNVKTAGVQTSNGDMSVSTYPTNVTASINNRPLPSGVGNLLDVNGKEAAPACLDRYWIISANNYSTNPVADVTFTYRDAEWDASTGGSTNNLVAESGLQGWKWNGTQWANPPIGTDNPAGNSVTVTGISGSAPWTLKGKELICGDFFLPTAFSPNGDGHNEFFKPRNNCIETLDFRIYNRWGNMVYASQDPGDSGWDGSIPGKGKDGNEGVYAYELKATMMDGTPIEKKGTVTLMK